MATFLTLAPIPKWLFTDLSGRPLAGGKMFTRSQLNNTQDKPVFSDPNGQTAYPNPIIFDENGMQGPFFWQLDDLDPTDTYFLIIKDRNDNPQFTISNYPKFNASGGGGGGETPQDLRNLITNSPFYRNYGDNIGTPIDVSAQTNVLICPGNHSGFSPPDAEAYGGDIRFIKSTTGATDSVAFVPFNVNELTSLDPNATPNFFLRTACTVSGPETYKNIQFAITSSVKNFSGKTLSGSFWARINSGANPTIALAYTQFFGHGNNSPSADVNFNIQAFTLDSSWQRFVFSAPVPSVAGKTLGNCGDDALFLQFKYPLGVAFSIDFANLELYFSETSPTQSLQTLDEVDTVISGPRTGDIRTSINRFEPFGWVAMNDGTIGSISSGATTRANVDTFPLYRLIWESTPQAIVEVAGGRGASAAEDFANNKTIQMTKALGRVLAGAPAFPAVAATTPGGGFVEAIRKTFTADTVTNLLTLSGGTGGFNIATPITVSSTGTLPSPLQANTVYYVGVTTGTTIAIALTPEDALAVNNIDILSAGTGTHTVQLPAFPLSTFNGEVSHTLLRSELPNPLTNTATTVADTIVGGPTALIASGSSNDGGIVNNAGGGNAISLMQPTAFYNMFAKL